MSWRTKLSARLGNDTIINDSINDFDQYMKNAENVKNVNINKSVSTIKMAIMNSSALDKSNEVMIGLTYLDDVVNVGDIVTWDNEDWIVVSKDDRSIKSYNKVGIKKTNNTLKFYNKTTLLCTIPCIIGKGNINAQETTYMTLAADEYIVICPNTTDSATIDMNTRFILSGSAYKVVGTPDNCTQVGLLNIKVKDDEINTVDDRIDLGIANYYSNQQTYEIVLLNNAINNLNISGDILQINAECKINGEVVTNQTGITYESSNTTLCTVSNTGLVTTQGKTGLCTITAHYYNSSASITINVVSIPVHNYDVTINGNNLTYGQQSTYNAIFTNSGVQFYLNAIWELKADDGISSTGLASIVKTSGTYKENCILKSNANSITDANQYFRLYVYSSDRSISNYKRIKIESLV